MFNRSLNPSIVAATAAAATLALGALVPAIAKIADSKVHNDRIISCAKPAPCNGGNNFGNGIGMAAESAANDGIEAWTNNQSTKTGNARSGIYGIDNSTDGGSLNRGVTAFSNTGFGLYAQSVGGTAISAYSQNWFGIVTRSDNAYPFQTISTPGNPQLPLWVISGMSDSLHDAIETYNSNSALIFGVDDTGNVRITGKLFTAGSCQNGCLRRQDGDHKVVSYAPSETLPTMEDTGEGRLELGRAVVRIDRAFGNVIDRAAGYSVLITPEGDSHGLYVTQKSPNGFEVLESQNGRSSIEFAYRIVAKPYGDASARLPAVVMQTGKTPHRAH